jgi:hypothetical protein
MCSDDRAVLLSVDYSLQQEWLYSFCCEIEGSFTDRNSSNSLFTRIQCTLSGKPDTALNRGLLIKARDVNVNSNVLDGNEQEHVCTLIQAGEYRCAINADLSMPQDSLPVSLIPLQEWDLYRRLIKVVPSLPERLVRPGFSWERRYRIPVATAQGDASIETYQYFIFDSIASVASGAEEAFISWRFRYTIDAPEFSRTWSASASPPLSGNGRGIAVLNLKKRIIDRAEMDFTTPVAEISGISVAWHERGALTLIPWEDPNRK